MTRPIATSPARIGAALTLLFAALGGTASVAGAKAPAVLKGSPHSMVTQHAVAVDEGLTFTRTSAQLKQEIAAGELVKVNSSADLLVHEQVPHPYARPEIRLFLQRLAAQYHEATGERLVVTSLVRPRSEQPRNAHPLSVHPVGMAVDLRVPFAASHRAWLQQALLGLERTGVLDVTREYHPPHFHVAVYPAEYQAYANRRIAAEQEAERAAEARRATVAPQSAAAAPAVASAKAAPQTAAVGGGSPQVAVLLIAALALGALVPVAGRARGSRR